MTTTWTILEPLSWPDTVEIAISYLAAGLPGVKVAALVPNPRVTPLVLVERAGGIASGIVDQARLAVQVWGTTAPEAADTAAACRDLLFRMIGVFGGYTVDQVVEVLGPTWAPDPETELPRYLLTIEARFRANPKGH